MKRGVKNLLLSLVGFSAAPILTACYGTPYDDYVPMEEYDSIQGYVVDTDMNPIKNIQIEAVDICHTDQNGHFLISGPSFYGEVILKATDIDGEENGGDFGSVEVPISHVNHATVSVVMSKK